MTTQYELERAIYVDLVERLEWDVAHGGSVSANALEDTYQESISETIDRTLIYTHDIMTLWADMGYPEPDDMADTVHNSILWAVALMACENLAPDMGDAVREVLENHSEHSTPDMYDDTDNGDHSSALEALQQALEVI